MCRYEYGYRCTYRDGFSAREDNGLAVRLLETLDPTILKSVHDKLIKTGP